MLYIQQQNGRKYARPILIDKVCKAFTIGRCPLSDMGCKWYHFCTYCGEIDDHNALECDLKERNTQKERRSLKHNVKRKEKTVQSELGYNREKFEKYLNTKATQFNDTELQNELSSASMCAENTDTNNAEFNQSDQINRSEHREYRVVGYGYGGYPKYEQRKPIDNKDKDNEENY